jgi:carbamoyltransferase
MDILGISAFFHDSAAALLRDGALVAAVEEERFTRRKHDPRFPFRAIEHCLAAAGVRGSDLDMVAFFEKPFLKLDRILATALATFPASWPLFHRSMMTWLADKVWVKKTIKETLGVPDERVVFVGHHLSHAASAFLCSPFEEAAILTIDGVGEWSTATLGVGRGTEVRLLRELRFPHSLGLLYSAFTAYLGFQVNEGEYKVMGLAPYGTPRYVDRIGRLVHVHEDGSFWLDMRYFTFHRSAERSFSRAFVDLFGPPRHPDQPFLDFDDPARASLSDDDRRFADIAASIQRVTEDIVLRMARHLHARTGLRRLCVAGGVGLNSVANSRLARETPFEELWVQPAAGDGGAALGAALYAGSAGRERPRRFVLEDAYWGPAYDDTELIAVLEAAGVRYKSLAVEEVAEFAAGLLASGRVIGWFQGRAEWGPRALGNRSILADPRGAATKATVNLKIKYREPFRPFAPSALAERADEFFDLPPAAARGPLRFMLLTVPVRPEARSRIPAVTHVDGSARVQVVTRETNPLYHALIERFGALTGVPVVLNTSFNLRGEPIVNTPREALATFFKSGLDALVLGRHVVEKPA